MKRKLNFNFYAFGQIRRKGKELTAVKRKWIKGERDSSACLVVIRSLRVWTPFKCYLQRTYQQLTS